jgi:hypothetical protein
MIDKISSYLSIPHLKTGNDKKKNSEISKQPSSIYEQLLSKIDITKVHSVNHLKKQLVLEILTHILGKNASADPQFKRLQDTIEVAISDSEKLMNKIDKLFKDIK